MKIRTKKENPRILIIQPYIPSYRVDLFEKLRTQLAANGSDLAIAAGRAAGRVALRGDDRTETIADFAIRSRTYSIRGKELVHRELGSTLSSYRPDYLIVEQAIKNLETWIPALTQRLPGKARVALWGQGRSYSTPQSTIEAHLKQWLTRRASWFFAYTQSGADHVVQHGFPRDRTTILWNTNDAESLLKDLESISSEELDAYRNHLGLTQGRTAIFLGGIDAHKGISFLLSAARLISDSLPGFRLLVGGAGDMIDAVRSEEGQGGAVRFLGRLEGRDKAVALAASDVVMIPEWVGLVAVDALMAQKPLITTDHPSHSPEFEYLSPDSNALITAHDTKDYAQAVLNQLAGSGASDPLPQLDSAFREDLSATAMASRFAQGIEMWQKQEKTTRFPSHDRGSGV